MTIAVGDLIQYEYRKPNTGRRFTCEVVGFRDGWVLDKRNGSFESGSFRAEDVVIWEQKPGKCRK